MIPRMIEQEGMEITINTTEDCNLRCKYCYEINKKKKYISVEDAFRFIDIILNDPDPIDAAKSKDLATKVLMDAGLRLDFIGGDSLMNVDQVDEIIEYFIYKINTLDNEAAKKWRNKWRCSLSSNGTLFEDPKVRAFCEKWKNVLSLGVSIDGCPEIHDKYRIMKERGPNGEEIGSMDKILKWWPWYRETFPNDSRMTKATCSKASIPYLYDSVKFIHEELGVTQIMMNFIMENADLHEEDYIELENQFRKLIPYILEHKDDLYWDFFSVEHARHHRSEGDDWYAKGHCGSGSMPCLGIDGNIYPCFRWLPHTQTSYGSPIIVGNLKDGLNHKEGFEQVRCGACRANCSQEKCRTCEYESACPYCIAGCYSEFQEFKRTVYICEVTKLKCKWAKVYWNEYNKSIGKPLDFDEEFTLENVKPWSPEQLES